MNKILKCDRLGQVEDARKHLCYPGLHPDPAELQKLQIVEKHINKCGDVRRIRDWNSVLREVDAAVAAGADSCVQVLFDYMLVEVNLLLWCEKCLNWLEIEFTALYV